MPELDQLPRGSGLGGVPAPLVMRGCGSFGPKRSVSPLEAEAGVRNIITS
jgi:hypothetical protein